MLSTLIFTVIAVSSFFYLPKAMSRLLEKYENTEDTFTVLLVVLYLSSILALCLKHPWMFCGLLIAGLFLWCALDISALFLGNCLEMSTVTDSAQKMALYYSAAALFVALSVLCLAEVIPVADYSVALSAIIATFWFFRCKEESRELSVRYNNLKEA